MSTPFAGFRIATRSIRAGALACVLSVAVLSQVSGQQPAQGPSAPEPGAAATPESIGALAGVPRGSVREAAQRLPLALALSTPEYPVTPGDQYLLSFLPAALARVSVPVVVGSDYTVDLGLFGTLDGRGLRFNDLRSQVVAMVEDAYLGSNPALLLTGVGVFEVHVHGAVDTAGYAATWGLGRLSELLSGRLVAHGSVRDVRVERGGATQVYDLFQAQRFGVRSQDPYLAPGDRVCVSRLERAVTIAGEVRRPGTYQLLTGEGLGELISYAGGFTAQADLQRVRIDSLGEPAPEAGGRGVTPGAGLDCDGTPFAAPRAPRAGERGTTRYAAWDAALARAPLRDGDVVRVADRDALLPAVFFEGAVFIAGTAAAADVDADDAAAEPAGTRITYRYRPGQTLFGALQEVRESIDAGADLANATFVRLGAPEEPIDLELLLHGGARAGDRALQPLDRIIIPARRFEVALRGEVREARQLTVSPLTRLNDVVDEMIRTPYTSIRRIAVASADGPVRVYDLFRWRRFGDLAHNPLLTPGATITFRERDRQVELAGAVRRPGAYQLLAGEGLPELIERYGDGFTAAADRTRVIVTRQNPANRTAAVQSIAVDLTAGRGPPLRDEDRIEVRFAPVPVIYLEGSLTDTDVTSTTASAGTTNMQRRKLPYHAGGTVYEILFPLRDHISDDADLRAGYVLRGGRRLPVDLERLLYVAGRAGNLTLQPYDTIVIPVRRLSVAVAGAVNSPGVFPYVPDRTAEYYIRLAGGRDRERSDGSGVTVTDTQGRQKARSAPLAPDDQVFVPADSFAYHFGRIIGPVATLGSLVIAIINLAIGLQ